MNEEIPKMNKQDQDFPEHREYRSLLEEIKKIEEKDENYSEKKPPAEFPENCIIERTRTKSRFVGFNGKRGIAGFCFGKQFSTDPKINDYRYVTQDIFNSMVKKLQSALDFVEEKNREGEKGRILLG